VPEAIMTQIECAVQSLLSRAGRRLLITAGPTCEDIDAVRFITNRATGRSGILLAEQAAARGWSALLILGPTPLASPPGVATVRVRSAQEMHDAVCAALPWTQALVMTAAVADYRPALWLPGKLKKTPGPLTLTLERTADILASVAAHPDRTGRTIFGFALDTPHDRAEGMRKLRAKNLDAILINTTQAFTADTSAYLLLRRDASQADLGTLSRTELASRILDELDALVP